MKSLNQLLRENLTRLMAEREISQNALGRLVGVSPRTIGNYVAENNGFTVSRGRERSARLVEVEAVARALRVPPTYLLTDNVRSQPVMSEQAQALGALFDKLTEQQQLAVKALLLSMPGNQAAKTGEGGE